MFKTGINGGMVLLSILPLVLMTTFRFENIGDTGAYVYTFKHMSTSYQDAFDILKETMKDKVFYFLVAILKCVIKDSALYYVYLFIIAMFQAIAVAFVGQFTELMDSSLSYTQYVNVVSDYKGINDDGTSIIRELIYSVPAIIAVWGRKKYNKQMMRL